jgi:hypothetical protein
MARNRLALCAIAFAACNNSVENTPAPPPAPVAAAPAPSKPPPDLSFGNGLAMRRPVRDGRLSLIPIVASGQPSAPDYVTLDEGMRRGTVSVRELPSWDVGRVQIHNNNNQPLFVMSGELIFDGLQDRSLAETRVIAPHDTQVVSVNCVEQGREQGSHRFNASHLLAELEIRKALRFQTQQDVWNAVARINQRLHLAPPTGTYRQAALLQTTGDAASRRDRMTHQLDAMPDHDRMVGLALAVDGNIVAIDQFASPALFAKLETELVGSYVASDDGVPHEGHSIVPADLRKFAERNLATTTDASTEILHR